jgi:hypothetical protein
VKVLIVCIHYPVCSGRYITDAFKRLGHDVRHIGPSTGDNIWGMKVPARHAWDSNGDLTAHWDDWTPDLVVIAESAWAYHHPVYQEVPHVLWGVDNHVRNYRQPGVTRYFLAHQGVTLEPYADDMEWLPCAYDPAVFTPSPIPFAERAHDVVLLGAAYPARIQALQALQKAGLKVVAGQGPLYEDYRDIYWQARVSLCLSAAQDVGFRVFETAAMGCAVLSDPCPDLKALSADGVVVFKTLDEMVKLAKELVKDGEQTAAVAAKWAGPHTWDARAQRVADWWRETYAPKPNRQRKVKAND